ncbi:MAG: fibronectin type III domain-containing protein, partial [Elusimicrobia bacterium]|nr:fibronectin type III domain-containing protein [Elusimicrobiota bacterium]
GAALGVSSVSWTWGAGAYADSYLVYPASSPASALGPAASTSYAQTGLAPNTTASVLVAGVNLTATGPQSSTSAVVYTLAAPPAGSAASAVYASSAALTWTLNGNSAGTTAEVELSTDAAVYSRVYRGTALSLSIDGMLVCTSYYVRVRDLNGDGLPSAYDSVVNVLTLPSTPTAAGGLSASPLAGDKVSLSWSPSPDESVTEYRLYWDSGTGTVSYASPLAVVPSSVTAYETGVLASSAAYRFALRAKNRCGIEEGNLTVAAESPALATLTGVRAAVTAPQSGQSVFGNAVTVAAELTTGEASQTSQVVFQYRSSAASAWVAIGTATVAPYFTHWDANALLSGTSQPFDLRAVAYAVGGSSDAAPASVSVTVIDNSANADVAESASGGVVTKVQLVNSAVSNTIRTGGSGTSGSAASLSIPSGALTGSTVTVTVTNNPGATPPPPSGAQAVGVVTQVSLSNGQTQLSGGQTASVTLCYVDADGDGVIDGTGLRADRLVMYSAESVAGPWSRDLGSSVDAANHCVVGHTPHFSFFGLFVPAASGLSDVRVYPVPYEPNSGDADRGVPYSPGNPNSGIVFDDLPQGASIKIYTVTGQRVASVGDAGSSGKLQWDVKNDRGHDAASGGYIAVISAPGASPVTKKVLVVR